MGFPHKTFWTVVTMVAIVAGLESSPELRNYRLMDWHGIVQVADFKPSRLMPLEPVAEAKLKTPLAGKAAPKRGRPGIAGMVEPLSDPAGSLNAFYEAIEQVESGAAGARVRLAHYGDSPTTADLITADVRLLLQQRFGDAGHGFYLIAKPWAWYGHRGVDSDSSGWDVEASNLVRNRDGLYGYGGVSFKGNPGARARFKLREAGNVSFEVAFRRLAQGGNVVLTACGERVGDEPTAGDPSDGFAGFAVPAACRDLTLTVEGGPVRLYGVSLSKAKPGVIYDSLGLNGAYISVLAKFLSEGHWAGQLQHYAPDVVVINYGTNESVYAAFVDKVFEKELRESIRRIKAALPGKGIVVMSPMDRGERNVTGEIETVAALERVVEIEKRVAGEENVAFFNTFEAMGGNGTMRKWYTSDPRLVGADFIHPMPGGAKIIGQLLYKAMLDGYNRYKTGKRASDVARNLE